MEDDTGKQIQRVHACCNSPEMCYRGEQKVGIAGSREVQGTC